MLPLARTLRHTARPSRVAVRYTFDAWSKAPPVTVVFANRVLRRAALIAVAFGACDCAARPRPVARVAACPPAPQTVHLVLDGTDRLNPDASGRALPTEVRVYQLKSITRLEEAEFNDVWQHPTETLRDDVISTQAVTLYPGESAQRAFTRDPAAQFVAAVAIVRRPAGSAWRASFDLPPPAPPPGCPAVPNAVGNVRPVRDPLFHFVVDGYRVEAEDDLPQSVPAGGLRLPGMPAIPALPGVEPPAMPGVEAPAMPGLEAPEAPAMAPPEAPAPAAPPFGTRDTLRSARTRLRA